MVVVVVRVRAAMRPRPKLGPESRALRTWPWKRRSKVGAHPVQPYLPQKMAPARLHLGPPPGVHEKLPSLMPQNSDVAGPTSKRTAPASPAVGGRGPITSPGPRGCLWPLWEQRVAFFSPAQPREASNHVPGEESFHFLDKVADKLLKWSLQVPAEPESLSLGIGAAFIYWGSQPSPPPPPQMRAGGGCEAQAGPCGPNP